MPSKITKPSPELPIAVANHPRLNLAIENIINLTTDSLSIIGGVLLLLGAVMILCSVIGRVLFDAPIPGDFELMEIIAAMAVFSFLPQLMWRQGNIVVKVISSTLADKYKLLLDKTAQTLFVLAYACLGIYGMLGAYEALIYDTQSQIWGFPIEFPMAYGAICLAISSLVSLAVLIYGPTDE